MLVSLVGHLDVIDESASQQLDVTTMPLHSASGHRLAELINKVTTTFAYALVLHDQGRIRNAVTQQIARFDFVALFDFDVKTFSNVMLLIVDRDVVSASRSFLHSLDDAVLF